MGLLSVCIVALLGIHASAHQKALHQTTSPQYETFQSQSSPAHSIRIRPQDESICDAHSRQWTGWLDIGHRHLFFWYFESQRDEQHDPLVLWQTGGPGAADTMALLMENGPCLINEHGNGTRHNPYGYSREASLLYIDSPAGVGFSYADKHTHKPSTSAESAEDIRRFLEIFLSQVFPHKKHVPFHITGESYSGHYTSHLAAEITRHNSRTHSEPFGSLVIIPLRSILMGNPLLSVSAQAFGYWETMCTTSPGVAEPVLNETTCDTIAHNLPDCMKLSEICDSRPDKILCLAAWDWCQENVIGFYDNLEYSNRFDITKPCHGGPDACYPEMELLTTYLNSRKVRDSLAVPEQVPPFQPDSKEVEEAFLRHVDHETSVDGLVVDILAAGIDVLIMEGKLDAACNAAGNRYWSSQLKWAGQAAFNTGELRPWFVRDDKIDYVHKGSPAGEFKEVRVRKKGPAAAKGGDQKKTRFAFATVAGAGHLVPHDKPQQALSLLRAWINGDDFA